MRLAFDTPVPLLATARWLARGVVVTRKPSKRVKSRPLMHISLHMKGMRIWRRGGAWDRSAR